MYAGGSFYRSEVRSDGSFSCSEIYADGSFCDFARVRFTALRCTFGCLVLRLCAARFPALRCTRMDRFAVWCGGLIGEVGSHTRTLHIGRRNYFRR